MVNAVWARLLLLPLPTLSNGLVLADEFSESNGFFEVAAPPIESNGFASSTA